MRYATVALLALAPLLGLSSAAQAEPIEQRVRIEAVRVGFPVANPPGNRYRTGAWAPVYVDLTVGPRGFAKGEAFLIVETTDSDDIQNRYTQELPVVPPREGAETQLYGIISYVRPGNTGSEVHVSVQLGNRTTKAFKYSREAADEVLPADMVVYLTAGSSLKALWDMAEDRDRKDQNLVERRRRTPAVEQARQLPTRWFGYEMVDVLVLPTGNEDFVKGLLTDEVRRDALAEWVRRGGKVVIGCGHNQQFVTALLDKMKLIDCAITGTVRRPRLTGLQVWSTRGGAFEQKRFEPPGGVEIAQLTPGKGVDVLVKEPPIQGSDAKERPLIVQAPAGMGRVVLVGLDFDEPPFTAWSGREDFWDRLTKEVQPPSAAPGGPDFGMQPWGFQNSSNEIASKLQDSMEHFGDVTPISFGWVALFILLYIAVVGPLDYFFLKLVVKRLELTWVTFPAVVVVISGLAYFTAYWLKGNDLKINKLDVVDFDLRPAAGADGRGPRMYGRTWLTLFSPRIQHYTLGVEPAEEWGAGALAKNETGAMVTWMGRPENVYGGTGRGSSQSLFRRAYDYAPEAAGLEGVPIQVWATKSFTASWSAPCPSRQPPFSAELRHVPDQPEKLTGSITSHLPVELHGAVLIYRKRVYDLGRLTPETPRRVEPLWDKVIGFKDLGQWIKENFNEPRFAPGKQGVAPTSESASTYIKLMLFHTEGASMRNSTLRDLDQSWRANRPDEVTILGRVDPQAGEGEAEKVTASNVAPSRLWLGELPDAARKRPELKGDIVQRTYVRVFIPVQPPQ